MDRVLSDPALAWFQSENIEVLSRQVATHIAITRHPVLRDKSV
jgi:hypothetical protein